MSHVLLYIQVRVINVHVLSTPPSSREIYYEIFQGNNQRLLVQRVCLKDSVEIPESEQVENIKIGMHSLVIEQLRDLDLETLTIPTVVREIREYNDTCCL